MKLVTIRVYAPGAWQHWPRYHCYLHQVPRIWLTWLIRGLRIRLGIPARGRPISVGDMLPFHPGRPARCLCRGTGILATHRRNRRGVQFCARMLDEFKAKAGFRCVDTRGGPHWLKGYEPERLVR